MNGLKWREGDMLAATVITPFIFAMIYGLYKFIILGMSLGHYLYTYIPVFGSMAAMSGFFIYWWLSIAPGKVSWKTLLILLGLLPYMFEIYIIGFLGIYMIYRGVFDAFSFLTIIAGLFWTAIGYRSIRQFRLMTELLKNVSH
jgi:hypothetical protein